MNEKRNAAREAALQKVRREVPVNNGGGDLDEITRDMACAIGFTAGYDAALADDQNPWVAVKSDEDLNLPLGLYWTTYIHEGELHIGSDRIYLEHQVLEANTIAYMRITEPQPFCGKIEAVEKGASNADSDLTKSNN